MSKSELHLRKNLQTCSSWGLSLIFISSNANSNEHGLNKAVKSKSFGTGDDGEKFMHDCASEWEGVVEGWEELIFFLCMEGSL